MNTKKQHLPTQADVVVIGGGVVGCSLAYHLAKKNVSTVLLERKSLTCGTTWHAAGLVGQLRASKNLTFMAKYSTDLYQELQNSKNRSLGFIQNGSLNLAECPGRMEEKKRSTSMGRNFGLDISIENIITSGSLIQNYFLKNNLMNQKCCVLGSDDISKSVTDAGGRIVSSEDTFQVLIIGAISGYPFVETASTLISKLFSIIDNGETVELILMNPDLLYPKTEDSFGLAAASLAKLIQEAVAVRYPLSQNLTFSKLGKPYLPIFEKAFSKTRTKKMVMIGDQLHTDIQGAKNFGIDSVLMQTGISSLHSEIPQNLVPTYRMKNLG